MDSGKVRPIDGNYWVSELVNFGNFQKSKNVEQWTILEGNGPPSVRKNGGTLGTGLAPSCLTPPFEEALYIRDIYPIEYPREIRCFWGFMIKGKHPNSSIIFSMKEPSKFGGFL